MLFLPSREHEIRIIPEWGSASSQSHFKSLDRQPRLSQCYMTKGYRIVQRPSVPRCPKDSDIKDDISLLIFHTTEVSMWRVMARIAAVTEIITTSAYTHMHTYANIRDREASTVRIASTRQNCGVRTRWRCRNGHRHKCRPQIGVLLRHERRTLTHTFNPFGIRGLLKAVFFF